jgi:hypothetical protein
MKMEKNKEKFVGGRYAGKVYENVELQIKEASGDCEVV